MWFIKWVPYPLTCSEEVTAQNTISVKPWMGNIRKQIPPIGRPSLINAKVRCLLHVNWITFVTFDDLKYSRKNLVLTNRKPTAWCILSAFEVIDAKKHFVTQPTMTWFVWIRSESENFPLRERISNHDVLPVLPLRLLVHFLGRRSGKPK